MTHLGKPGNFSPWTKKDPPSKGLVQHHIFEKNGEYSPPPADAEPDEDPVGEGMHTEREVQQWSWVQVWDKSLPEPPTWTKISELAKKPPLLAEVKDLVKQKKNKRKKNEDVREKPENQNSAV